MTNPPEYVDEDHAAIAEFAAAFLDPDEVDEFVDHLMERRGYTRVHSWAPGAGDGGQGDGGAGDGGQGDGGGQSSRGRGPAGGRGRGPARTPAQRRSPYFKR